MASNPKHIFKNIFFFLHIFLSNFIINSNSSSQKIFNKCPIQLNYKIPGADPTSQCELPIDPNKLSPSFLERWFTREMFEDLFPFSNLGWGPHPCSPYSYEAFVIAARYFPSFGEEISLNNGFTPKENSRRDVANFLAHAIQETGLNDISVYQMSGLNLSQANECFFRGGLYNWFEGGPVSAFLAPSTSMRPEGGDKCIAGGRYCSPSPFFECGNETEGKYFKSCYFGRGAIQISYNYNYGQFGDWLKTQNISADLLKHPNLVLTKRDPPLALLASLWFYMSPQPPKPAMHDIILGQWNAGSENEAEGYSGPIFGPTSLIINNECTGEDPKPPGGGGENRRIRAFKWLCEYFNVPADRNEKTLTCKNMPRRFDQIPQNVSWEPDWSTTWREDNPCQCAPATYAGLIPYYQPGFYPSHFVNKNEENRKKCEEMISGKYSKLFGLDSTTSGCLNFTMNTKIENNTEKMFFQIETNNNTNLINEDKIERILDLTRI